MKTIVIGVIGADVHAVGNKIIEYVLKNEGYNPTQKVEADIHTDIVITITNDAEEEAE